jgi:G3E family GTPase
MTPVILNLFTGLLGAGKTAVLRHLLEDKSLRCQPAVVVGEFAEQGVDASMLAPTGALVRQLADAGTGERAKSYVEPLKELVKSGSFDRIYIETSGVTEIDRVVSDLLLDDELRSATLFGPTVVVIDAGAFAVHDAHFGKQFWGQLDVADLVVINKVDMAKDAEVDAMERRIGERNPGAKILRAYMGQIRRAEVNSPVPEGFLPRLLADEVRDAQPREFESFIYASPRTCFDRVAFGHLLLNLPDTYIARFKGKLKSYDKTYCVNGFPGRLDWDNTPVTGSTSIALIGLELASQRDRIKQLLDDELDRQNDHSRGRRNPPRPKGV